MTNGPEKTFINSFEMNTIAEFYEFLAKTLHSTNNINIQTFPLNGSGNGLVPSGNKPSPKPMLTKIYKAVWHH